MAGAVIAACPTTTTSKVDGATPAHLVRAIHRVFSNLKRWAPDGLRRAHLRRYLDEFVFRWNRRRHTATAFDTLLGIGTRLRPADYRDIVGPRLIRPGAATALRSASIGAEYRPSSLPGDSLKSKSSRTSPGTVRKPCLERRTASGVTGSAAHDHYMQ